LLEIAAFSAVICVLHRLKPHLGLAPMFLVVGLFEAFLFVAGKKIGVDRISAPMFLSPAASVSYMLFLPVLLASMVLIYVLEGTAAARRYMLAVICVYLVHGAIDVILKNHAAMPPDGAAALHESALVYYKTESRIASLGARITDFVVIIVSYQFLVNRLKNVPLVIPLFIALVFAMMTDAVVYTLLRGRILEPEKFMIIEKLQAGIAAGLPMALYLAWQLRVNKEQVDRGILERGAFAIIDLRLQVKEIEAQLSHVRDTFGRYVSSQVVDTLLSDPSKLKLGGELRDVTIMFADIRGYSTMSEAMEPTEVIDLLNRYYERVTTVIMDQEGMINEIEGDAVLAVFGAPNDLPDHAFRALCAARGMLSAVDELNLEFEADGTNLKWKSVGIQRLGIRVGIHSGPVVAGNVGSEQRTKYAVIGDTVNTASRVEGLNKKLNTDLLMTASTVAQIEAGGHEVATNPMGRHPVRGRKEDVEVFTLG
jgi:class 3 adenylate cyclase